jgi:OsmC-like protein
MDRDALRAVQEPLKERYCGDPEAALVRLSASGELDAEAIACSVATGRALRVELDADDDDERVATLIRLTERYCVVLQTLAGGVPVALAVDRRYSVRTNGGRRLSARAG